MSNLFHPMHLDRFIGILLTLSALALPARAANPFLPGWEYIPDGEPRVFGDRVYLYGSHDRAGSQEFCDTQLRVWSAPLKDLNTWTDHGIIFSTRTVEGHADDVPWSDNNLYAPDVIQKDGRYYLFAQIVGSPCAVAVADSPTGPFRLISQIQKPKDSPMDFGGWSQYFDPGVLVDDDGRVYLYWGGGSSHMAELNPANMTEILPGTYRENILPTTPPFNYQEGPSPRKINGIYYLVFAAGNDLSYATSDSPTGPFAYRGVIVSHVPDAPGGNIHGGLAELNGQWYIFYHRMTHNTVYSRRACAERVTIQPDGSIPRVEQTSLGFQTSLDPYRVTPADIACVLRGGNYVTELDRDTRPVVNNRNGRLIGFRYFDFGNPAVLPLSLRVRGGETSCRIKIEAARPGEAPVEIGEVQVDADTSGTWREFSTEVKPVSGRAAILFTFVSGDPKLQACDLLSFSFGRERAEARTASAEPSIPEIYLNQSGFDPRYTKRFTAPTLPEGTPFVVRAAGAGPKPEFSGVISAHIGDFTAFAPTDGREYVVEAGGIVSVPFRVRPWWLERVTYQRMVDFMVDSRHYVGNDRATCSGSFGWRDDHHFGWELHTLVPQYLSNPSAYDRMPRQVRHEAPAKPGLWGALQPYDENAPDIVKLIHWGADVIVSQKLTHELLKSQLAYFLYAWPVLKKHMPEQNYTVVRDYVLATWTQSKADRKYPYDASSDHNLLALKTKIGSTKGELPPGFSVEPNVLLHAVARRDGLPDADRYLAAARAQAAWMVENLDWAEPRLTKGQRLSEFITLTGLATFLRLHPHDAPPGLAAYIESWTRVMIRRSENMWDFRKLDDAAGWTPMEPPHPQKWNEPGNVAGLPAALLAVKAVTADPNVRRRLDEIASAHLDNVFGRNPVGRHFSYDAPREVEGVEHGWFTFCPGGIGRLAEARFVLDGSPKDFHYPYHPELKGKGYTEGWIQFNTPFNASMAYLAFDRTALAATRHGDRVRIRLCAPINFDDTATESAVVQLTTPGGLVTDITVTEESASSPYLTASVPASQVPADSVISYGFGYLGHSATIP